MVDLGLDSRPQARPLLLVVDTLLLYRIENLSTDLVGGALGRRCLQTVNTRNVERGVMVVLEGQTEDTTTSNNTIMFGIILYLRQQQTRRRNDRSSLSKSSPSCKPLFTNLTLSISRRSTATISWSCHHVRSRRHDQWKRIGSPTRRVRDQSTSCVERDP